MSNHETLGEPVVTSRDQGADLIPRQRFENGGHVWLGLFVGLNMGVAALCGWGIEPSDSKFANAQKDREAAVAVQGVLYQFELAGLDKIAEDRGTDCASFVDEDAGSSAIKDIACSKNGNLEAGSYNEARSSMADIWSHQEVVAERIYRDDEIMGEKENGPARRLFMGVLALTTGIPLSAIYLTLRRGHKKTADTYPVELENLGAYAPLDNRR